MTKTVAQLIIVSDLHTCSDNAEQMLDKLGKLALLAGSKKMLVENVILVCAGDITYSGLPNEFNEAKTALELFAEGVRERCPSVNLEMVMAPGNHDIDLMTKPKFYQKILKEEPLTDENLDVALERQDAFFKFESEMSKNGEPDNRVFWQRTVPVTNSRNIHFNIINSSCLTYLNQEKGVLKLPVKKLFVETSENKDDISISIMHHPLSWLDDTIRKAVSRKIRTHSCALITGHEHIGDDYVVRADEGEVMHIECGVCGEKNEMNSYAVSAYISIEEDDVISCTNIIYKWDGNNYVKKDEREPVLLRGSRYVDGFSFSEEFAEWLDELPTGLNHTVAGKLKFDDIYVDRRLRYTDGPGGTLNTIDSDLVIREQAPTQKSIITGEDSSGKTMLAKNYIKKLFANGKVPLYFDGGVASAKNIEKLLEKAYASQYSGRKFDEYLKINYEERAIVIDNFESITLKDISHADLLEIIEKCFSVVIVLADESEYLNISSDAKLFSVIDKSYSVYKLLELSPKAIDRIVEKWNALTPHANLSSRIIEEQNLEMESKLQRLTGRSLVPRYPSYILLFLYALTNEKETARMTEIGTYGSLYEIVIRKQLTNCTSRKFDLQSLSAYLEELAFYLFALDKKWITEIQYYDFARQFNETKGTTYSPAHILSTLKDAEIIEEKTDHQNVSLLSFAHDYYYYYFVAKYFASNIGEKRVKEYVSGLCKGFSDVRNANIWLFLTHLSRDKFIIETICNWADSLFDDISEIRFEGDVEFIERMRKKQKNITFNDTEYKTAKEERLKKEEERYEIESSSGRGDDTDVEPGSENMTVIKLMMAYRTIDILGQLLRNFTGSLKAVDKIKLLKTTYRLSLRTIEFIVSHFRTTAEDFIKELAEYTHELDEKISKEDAFEKFSSLFHDMFMSFSYFIMNKVAVAVAHEQLVAPYGGTMNSFKDENEEGKVSNALTLLHAMVTLTATKKVPQVFELDEWKIIEKRPFCKSIFRHAVLRFCYTHPVDRVEKEKACAYLGVQYKNMLVRRH